jgi:hypothetical protein
MSQVKGIATLKLAIYEISFWGNTIYNPENFQTKKKVFLQEIF